VSRLRDNGVIDKVVALLNPEAVGKCLCLIVEVTMERDARDLYKRFESRVVSSTQVTQCYQVTGEIDFVLMLTVRDMDEYDEFCNSVLYADDNLKKFRTLISRKRSKFDTAAPLPFWFLTHTAVATLPMRVSIDLPILIQARHHSPYTNHRHLQAASSRRLH